jgi:glutathione synthase/RimK-type ligase-like ATP-grasp enzyme
MSKLAFLSIDDLSGYVTDDDLAIEPLRELGWDVETVSWRQTRAKWNEYAAVIIRTTWDYQKNLPTFLRVLREIDSNTRLANSLSVATWNADKIYLRKLEERGANIVPTIWRDHGLEKTDIAKWFDQLQTDEIVIKPNVSANAENTFRLHRNTAITPELIEVFANRSYMVQPFMRGIVEEGEFSLFYFGGEYSHAILKTPKTSDFRVQEEHGGVIQPVQPTARLLTAGEKILQFVKPTPLYARADFVRDENDNFALIELELIEPSLYFRKDEHAPRRFANAINNWLLQN